MANLDLWNSVERTNPAHVKAITGKSYQGSSPKPHYLVHKATETFGPCGIGWGFNIVSERIEDGADGTRMHIAHVRVWYKWNGETGSVEHVGGTEFCGKRKSGQAFTDEDAPKKSITDALVKALSMIGFAGDIFMGRYDDSKYINDIKREIADEAKTEPETTPPKPPTTRTVAAEKAKYKELKDEMTKESANGSKAMKRWVNDKSVLADIEGLERYSEDFKQEFREVLELAEIAERELGEPAQVSRSLPDFSNMEPNDLPEDTREAVRNFGAG